MDAKSFEEQRSLSRAESRRRTAVRLREPSDFRAFVDLLEATAEMAAGIFGHCILAHRLH